MMRTSGAALISNGEERDNLPRVFTSSETMIAYFKRQYSVNSPICRKYDASALTK
jgi:hypothetical protein